MVHADALRSRRERLLAQVDRPVLLLGNGESNRNLPMNKLPFRQDSTFLYFTGCPLPDAAALLGPDGYELFLPAKPDDDALWHGVTPSVEELGERYGADRVRPLSELEGRVAQARPLTLAVADEQRNQQVSAWVDEPLRFGSAYGHRALVDAVIGLRQAKGPEEIEELKAAAAISRKAFEAVMAATRPGSHENSLTVLFEAVLGLHGCTTGYASILTQSGEVLHNHDHDDPLQAGRMVLLDGGGERPSGYTVDITRTWPVSGRFTDRQRAAYEAVLAAQKAAIARCTVGTRYREVHDEGSRVLATWLRDEGLLRCSPDEAVERGAHAVFFPHGMGHHLGLDVHDLENFGDLPSYPADRGRPDLFGTGYLRLDLPLQRDWVVTVEPGFYVVPAILRDAALRERLSDAVDFDAAEAWLGFGGIRIEDDIHVTADGPVSLTTVPKEVDEVEALVGSGPTAEERLG
jgi:Xaa-Pro aminopeptidase